MKKKTLLFSVFLATMTSLCAQKEIIVEDIRCYAGYSRTMTYWQFPETRLAFAAHLNTITRKYFKQPIADTASLKLRLLKTDTERRYTGFSTSDTNHLHLFLDIFEYAPAAIYLDAKGQPADSAELTQTKAVFHLSALLANSRREVILNKSIDLALSEGETAGIGIPSGDFVMTPRGFTEMLKAGFNILLDTARETDHARIQVAPAFLVDDVITPLVAAQSRNYITEHKGIATYGYNGQQEMLRMSDPYYRVLKLRGKHVDKLPVILENAFRNTDLLPGSDFVFLYQEARDVLRDKNYRLQLAARQVTNPLEAPLTAFVKDTVHYLLRDNDTVARFSIATDVTIPGKKVYPYKTWNGYDPLSVITLMGTQQPAVPFAYAYVITGKIGKDIFSIQCGAGNTVKQVWLNEKPVAVVQGKFMPQRFVIFDASLSAEQLNQLLMIGFARFFE